MKTLAKSTDGEWVAVWVEEENDGVMVGDTYSIEIRNTKSQEVWEVLAVTNGPGYPKSESVTFDGPTKIIIKMTGACLKRGKTYYYSKSGMTLTADVDIKA
ncbi:MAG: hypothetical protein JNM34_11235 [Chthonomonadaceae bacterium]|nr:hypothetical protein [Chthonomonadaceae bacterium]